MPLHNWKQSVRKSLEKIKGRKLILLGDDLLTEEIYQTLRDIKRDVELVVSNDMVLLKSMTIIGQKAISFDDFEQMEYNREEFYILVFELTGHKEAYTLLINKGFQLDNDFSILGIGGFTLRLNRLDSLLTLNRQYENDLLGFKTFSNCNYGGAKIVILGNSTSDPSTGNLKCWAIFLLDELSKRSVDATIYNGAITGYSSSQEYLKLNRDVFNLNPDIVISFSGYNDVIENSYVSGFPYLHKYELKFYDFLLTNSRLAPDSMFVRNLDTITHGIPSKNRDFQIWIENMDRMNAICTLHGVNFFAFLQPMMDDADSFVTETSERIIKAFIDKTNSIQLSENVKTFVQNVRLSEYNGKYIRDITKIFAGQKDMFYDTCHYTEKGNKLIAECVFKNIENALKRWL